MGISQEADPLRRAARRPPGILPLVDVWKSSEDGYNYWLPGVKNFSLSFAVASRSPGDGPWIVRDALHGLAFHWMGPCGDGGPQAALSNLVFYPSVLLGLFWIFAPPPLLILGFVRLWEIRHELVASLSDGSSV